MLLFFPTLLLFPDIFCYCCWFLLLLFIFCLLFYVLINSTAVSLASVLLCSTYSHLSSSLSVFSFWRNHMRNLLTYSSKQDWLSLHSMHISYPGSQPLVDWLSALHSFLYIGLLFHFRGAHLSVGRSLCMRKNAWEVNFL